MNKFEKLIEYVINDEDNKAADLFHEIVVEKSRDIYEDLMKEDDVNEEDVEDVEEEVEADEITEDDEEMAFGGEEEELALDDESEEGEFDIEMGAEEGEADEEDLEDRVVDLEDKLDELMSEFDELMGDEEGEAEFGDEEDAELGGFGDEEMAFGGEEELALDDEEEFEESANPGFFEGADLKPAPKPTTAEEGSVNKKTANADNAGAKGQTNGAKPVKAGSAEEKGRKDPTVGSLTDANTEAKPLSKVSKGVSAKKSDGAKSVAKQNNK